MTSIQRYTLLFALSYFFWTPTVNAACVPAPNVTQSSLNCNANVTLQAFSSDGSDGNYLYYLYNSSQVRIDQNATGQFSIIVNSPTVYYISIYDQDNSCESTKKIITAVPGAPPSLSAYGYACTPSTASVFMSGTSGATFSLLLYDGYGYNLIASNTTGTFSINNFSASYQYYAKVEIGSCSAQSLISIPIDVTVPNVSGPTSACNGQTITLQASGANNGAYRWYDDATLTHQISLNSSISQTVYQTTTYYVVNYGEFCQSNATPFTVNVYNSNTPLISSATGFGQVTLSVSSSPANTTFKWYDALSGGNVIYTTSSQTLTSTSTYYVSSVLNQGGISCESGRTSVTGTIIADPIISQNGTLTAQTQVTLSTSPYNSYQWVKNGVNISGATGSTLVVTTAGHYKVLVSSAGVQGQGMSAESVVKYHVAAPTITQSNTDCNNAIDLQAYSSDGSDGNYNYYLYNSALTKIDEKVSGAFAVTVNAPTVYYVSIYDNDNAFESAKTSITISPGVPPSLSAYGYSCSPGTAVVFMTGDTNTTFNLLRYDGAGYSTVGSNASGNFSFNTISDSYQYYGEAVVGTCSTRKLVTITPDYVSIPQVSGLLQLCSGSNTTLHATASNNSFAWYDDAALTHSVGNTSSFIPNNTTSNTYYVVNYGEFCKSSPAVVTVSVYLPIVPQINSASGFGQVTLSVVSPPANTSYNWYSNSSTETAFQHGSNITFASNTTVYVSSVLTNGSLSCESNRVMVNGIVLMPPLISKQGSLNMGNTVTLSVAPSYSSYQWYKNGISIQGSIGNSLIVSDEGKYNISVTLNSVQGQGVSTAIAVDFNTLSDENYVIVNTVTADNVYTSNDLHALTSNGLSQTVQYFDGLGRPMQSVGTQSSPSKLDVVTPVVYDIAGREVKKYLPISIENNGLYKPNEQIIDPATGNYIGAAQPFYLSGSNKVANDTRPFSETIFEPSPLNRPSQQFGPGQNWKDNNKSVDHQYLINQTNEVIFFTYDPSTGLVSTGYNAQPAYYSAGQLHANVTTDEHGNDVIEYIDKLGRTVCKNVQYGSDANGKLYASTYYIYDDLGNLAVVLPPEVIKSALTTLTSQN
ncbi:MAG: hypothetical protein HYR67_04760 [Bacteroidetes bacterium]|nr:hypothetical protein [Bacteroidota bacterium]